MIIRIAAGCLLFALLSCGNKQQADLIVTNGNIYTVDAGFSNCQAMAIVNGTIDCCVPFAVT